MAARGTHMREILKAPESAPAPMPTWELPVAAAVLFLSSWAVSLNAANALLPNAALRIVLFLAGVWSYRSLRSRPFEPSRGLIVQLSVFCGLLGLVLLLGGHIHFSAGEYHADQTKNYIRAYGPADILTYILQLPLLGVLCTRAYLAIVRHDWARPRPDANTTATPAKASCPLFSPAHVDWHTVLILAAILFAAWAPYLLAYWPGYIFGDSMRSIGQVAGAEPLSNHDPVLYTLFVGFCLNVGGTIFGDRTAGVALYSIIQMGCMAVCLAYLSVWIQTHLQLSSWWLVVFAALFGGTAYVANYSIAMWKDPFFSCSLVMLTLCLANLLAELKWEPRTSDEAYSIASVGTYPWSLAICALATAFTRNNGAFICLVVVIALAVVLLRLHVVRIRPQVRIGFAALPWALLAAATIVSFVVTGPVFSALGLNTDGTVESAGLMVSQMARVPATDGNMSSDDKAYLDRLYPLENYHKNYPPSCIDSLKWDPDFDASALDDDLLGHWLSLGIKNPGTYFEAWQLQTAGFWSLGYEGQEYFNIALGAPVNLQDPSQKDTPGDGGGERQTASNSDTVSSSSTLPSELSKRYGIDVSSLLPEGARDVLVSDEWSVPAGWILWLMAFVIMCLVGARLNIWTLLLVPGLGLMATLVLASPIIYWPRYALGVQLLLPFYVAVLVRLRTAERSLDYEQQPRS